MVIGSSPIVRTKKGFAFENFLFKKLTTNKICFMKRQFRISKSCELSVLFSCCSVL